MENEARRAVAYIAGRALSGTNSGYLYDYSARKYFNFGGSVDPRHVSVYDYTRRYYASESLPSLYDYGRRVYLQLKPEQSGRFSGYGYGCRTYFNGPVSGQAVQLYDYETQQLLRRPGLVVHPWVFMPG